MSKTNYSYSEAGRSRQAFKSGFRMEIEDGWLRLVHYEGWPITLMLVNAIGFIYEAADHHGSR